MTENYEKSKLSWQTQIRRDDPLNTLLSGGKETS